MNLLSVRDLSPADLLALSEPPSGSALAAGPATGVAAPLRGTLAFLFEQPSLRTMASFAAAAVRVGLVPIPITTAGNRFRDQTAFADEVRQLALTTRCVVVRSHARLLPADYALCPVPIVNGGDGDGEHPSQTLIDLAAMRMFGLEGRRVALMGNMRDHRTAHSLALALGRLGVPVRLVSPPGLRMDGSFADGPGIESVAATTVRERDAALADADFVYCLPTMSLTTPERTLESVYALDLAGARRALKPGAKILHPFPRFGELAHDLDHTAFDAYHLQTSLGPFVRERLLRHLVGLEAEAGAADPAQRYPAAWSSNSPA